MDNVLHILFDISTIAYMRKRGLKKYQYNVNNALTFDQIRYTSINGGKESACL